MKNLSITAWSKHCDSHSDNNIIQKIFSFSGNTDIDSSVLRLFEVIRDEVNNK